MRTISCFTVLLSLIGFNLSVSQTFIQLTSTPTQNERHPSFSPDGNKIVFTRDGKIWSMDSRGESYGSRQLTTTDLSSYGQPKYSPDGTKVLISSGQQLFVMDTVGEGDGLTQLTINGGYDADWSPDGKNIVLERNQSGNTDVFLMDSRGESYGIKRLTADLLYDGAPTFSPDGSKIIFTSGRSGGLCIWEMDTTGESSGLQKLTSGDDDNASLSPHGSVLLYTHSNLSALQIIVKNLLTNDILLVADSVGWSDGSWSPDGKSIAFDRNADIWLAKDVDFRRLYPCGDVNIDGKTTLADIIFLVNYLFNKPGNWTPCGGGK